MADETPLAIPQDAGAGERAKALELLRRAPFASFAMVDGRLPYVVPLNFAYVDSPPPHGRLLFHTGEGRKSAALCANGRICVTASAGERFKQGDKPCSDGFAFGSIVAEGSARLLEDLAERTDALDALVAKYDPSMAGQPFDERVLSMTLVYEITIETLSYRELP